MHKGFTLRFIIYGVIVVYMLLDMNVLKGPLHNWILAKKGKNYTELREDGVAALVYGQPILDTQVKFEMESYLYKRGRHIGDVTPEEYPILFNRCLQALISSHLLRVKTHHNEQEIPPTSAGELSEAIDNQLLQFGDVYERKDAIRRQGMTERELELRAEADLQQRAYLNRQIYTELSEEELAIYEGQKVSLPERIHLRHIFLSTWEKDAAEVKARLTEEVAKITSKELSFSELSDLINEDDRAKEQGGDLGWISAERIPEGLGEVLFTLPLKEPVLVLSSLGWHYAEVLEKKPEETIARSEEEIQVYLENQKRSKGLDFYLERLRLREKDNVSIIWNRKEGENAR